MLDRIQAARRRLHGQAHRTPIITSRSLNEASGAKVYLKCEHLQRAGAFKFRGAYNAIAQLSRAQKARGIITYSSGNHAQAVALVGRLLDVRTVVVMPADAPSIKRAATEGYGAEVIAYNPAEASRQVLAEKLAAEHGYTVVPPFDHTEVIAGQGTAAYELLEDLKTLDMLLVPCGGGGLLSGSAVACKHLAPDCRVLGVEPELADDATRSYYSGTLQQISYPQTIADGTRTTSLGRLTFPLIMRYVDGMTTVSEEAIMAAVRFLFYRLKLVVEPSGALGVAALLSRTVVAPERVGVLLSGGNIDGATMARILNNAAVEDTP